METRRAEMPESKNYKVKAVVEFRVSCSMNHADVAKLIEVRLSRVHTPSDETYNSVERFSVRGIDIETVL
jgi:hypothetical protein